MKDDLIKKCRPNAFFLKLVLTATGWSFVRFASGTSNCARKLLQTIKVMKMNNKESGLEAARCAPQRCGVQRGERDAVY